jgi:hypothetical protein
MADAPRQRGLEIGDIAPHLFLSHSSRDNETVRRIAWDLNVCGVDVWFDEWELRVGDDLHNRIANAISKSKFVGVVIGDHFDSSKWMRGEVSQALSREKVEDRTLVLPLVINGKPPPAIIGSKKFLDFGQEQYFPSLLRLIGLVHDLDTQSVEDGIRKLRPSRVRDCVSVLRYCDFEPYCIVDTKTVAAIKEAGGIASGTKVSFDPATVLSNPNLPPATRELVERLVMELPAWTRGS